MENIIINKKYDFLNRIKEIYIYKIHTFFKEEEISIILIILFGLELSYIFL